MLLLTQTIKLNYETLLEYSPFLIQNMLISLMCYVVMLTWLIFSMKKFYQPALRMRITAWKAFIQHILILVILSISFRKISYLQ